MNQKTLLLRQSADTEGGGGAGGRVLPHPAVGGISIPAVWLLPEFTHRANS